MDEQKEKRGMIQRETHEDDHQSQPDHIPLDLTLEIISRLPPKSIIRYRCVSKLWSSFTTLPSIINSFASRSSERPRSLVLILLLKEKFLVFSFPQNKNPDGSYSQDYSYHMENTSYDCVQQSNSVQGLMLFTGFRIWNPSLMQVLTLPHPNEHIPFESKNHKPYLGYDPVEGKHKALCLSCEEYTDQPLILTLGAQESWRIAKERCPMHRPIIMRGYGRCFNGILYYKARLLGDDHDIIIGFDVKSEKFNIIKFPEDRPMVYYMEPYEGRLALVFAKLGCSSIYVDLYVLEDSEGQEWRPLSIWKDLDRHEWNNMRFRGITDAGELVFAPYTSSSFTFYFVYFDPRRISTREVLFEDVVDGDFRRRHGLTDNQMYCTDVFPNHMESLVSL